MEATWQIVSEKTMSVVTDSVKGLRWVTNSPCALGVRLVVAARAHWAA